MCGSVGPRSKTTGTHAPICRRRIVCTACVCAGRIGGIGTLVFPDDYPRPGLLVWPAGPPSQRLNQYCRLSWTRTAAVSPSSVTGQLGYKGRRFAAHLAGCWTVRGAVPEQRPARCCQRRFGRLARSPLCVSTLGTVGGRPVSCGLKAGGDVSVVQRWPPRHELAVADATPLVADGHCRLRRQTPPDTIRKPDSHPSMGNRINSTSCISRRVELQLKLVQSLPDVAVTQFDDCLCRDRDATASMVRFRSNATSTLYSTSPAGWAGAP